MKHNRVVGLIPKILFKIFLYLKEKFDPKPEITEEEHFAEQICQKMILHPYSKLNYSPISSKRIIKNESLNMYIVMESYTIHLINHVYSYSVYFQETEKYQKLTENFDKMLEQRREEIELEIKNNIQHSLETILKKLD